MILPNHALDCKREASSANTILLSFLARAFSHILPENVLSLHPKGKSANMPGMKISRFMIAVAVGMAVVSCSSPSEFPNPDACDVAPDSAQPQNGEKGGKKNGDTTNKSNVDEQPSGGENITPSEEQQAAAEQMLSETDVEESESLDVLPQPVGNEELLDEVEPMLPVYPDAMLCAWGNMPRRKKLSVPEMRVHRDRIESSSMVFVLPLSPPSCRWISTEN